ncbi:OCIA domain-containing protein 1 [Salminus brasiliensis]|uniref:OCIA domain-containing protein 1 n=1 Tax=Salminus brasiliensis TaxID=930266 RepID=UPI003B839E4A
MDRSSFSDYRGSDSPGETGETTPPAGPAEYPQAKDRAEKRLVEMNYVPTEEEKRLFRECNTESFWYRSVPISVTTMTLTQILISRGVLTASTRFGSLPKVFFAGICGYVAGKISYVKNCREKFRNLENSPLEEVLRNAERLGPPVHSRTGKEKTWSEPVFQSDTQRDTLPSTGSYSQNTHSSDLPSSRGKTNKYGDSWEE